MTLPLVLLVGLLIAWGVALVFSRRDASHSPLVRRELRRVATEGEILPALWEDPSTPVIRVNLPRVDDAPLQTIETRRPTRQPSLESDVLVPFAQSALTGLAALITSALLTWAFGWSWRVVLITTGITLAGAWLWRLRLVDGLLWSVETLLSRDLNRDGALGRPHGPVLVNPTEARGEVAALASETAADSRRRDLLAFVARCYTVGTAEAAHGVRATGPDRARYVELRDALLALGVARWRNPARPRAGWVMAVSQTEAATIVTEHVL